MHKFLRDTHKIGSFNVSAFSSLKEAVEYIFPESGERFFGALIAVNAEKLVKSTISTEVIKNLGGKSIFYADGYPVARILKSRGLASERIAGVELWEASINRCFDLNRKILLIGSSEDINKTVARLLCQRFPGIDVSRINGFSAEDDIVEKVRKEKPDFISVAMGSPRQEELISRLMKIHPATYMGVGGTYDVYSGAKKRAPKLLRNNGLEWLYRLGTNPTRILRYAPLAKFYLLWVCGRYNI
ncbi:WecB/TagA/CpsF family glycosyltransferase [Falsigemmobacter faecalis]|uniref:WecB/TagA/CpsF family glycosyltransferase n=1 Tax=Falsigemmobacter faecalis TaxID=2488730 RepID=A0A3P3D1M4_9RHOB|nr:WecB/TagA/CpsF family glycosyltransferase [Falsigemmobacter faecalis]RRH68347.1 WecB/TagA/CpsF family glycosyltransferase [Falsigemmobacter faecalis]